MRVISGKNWTVGFEEDVRAGTDSGGVEGWGGGGERRSVEGDRGGRGIGVVGKRLGSMPKGIKGRAGELALRVTISELARRN